MGRGSGRGQGWGQGWGGEGVRVGVEKVRTQLGFEPKPLAVLIAVTNVPLSLFVRPAPELLAVPLHSVTFARCHTPDLSLPSERVAWL